jgi:L-asparaginase
MMKKILIISTGGTFNKVYNRKNGNLEIDKHSHALDEIASKWLIDFEIYNIIGKDSLDMNDQDRALLLETIKQSNYNHIIIIHGTDTIDITAEYLAKKELNKSIVLTGAMVPYSIDSVEATANFASAYGYIQTVENGVYIAMNGIINSHTKVKKNHKKGKFTL